MAAPTNEDFQKELENIFGYAATKQLISITVNSGNLHRIVGQYPGPDHRMPVCCNVMEKNMKSEDEIISSPPKGQGASLEIRYKFPRT